MTTITMNEVVEPELEDVVHQHELVSYHRNPMRIRSCVQMGRTLYSESMPIGWKKGFEWILDDETMCAEWINGTNICMIPEATTFDDDNIITESVKNTIFTVRTRRAELSVLAEYELAAAIGFSMDIGTLQGAYESSFANPNSAEKGIIYGTWAATRGDNEGLRPLFVTRNEQLTKLRFKQWEDGPKSFATTSMWLFEDIQTNLPKIWKKPLPYTRKLAKRTSDTVRRSGWRRPDGLLFYHPSTQRWARMRIEDCGWNHVYGENFGDYLGTLRDKSIDDTDRYRSNLNYNTISFS